MIDYNLIGVPDIKKEIEKNWYDWLSELCEKIENALYDKLITQEECSAMYREIAKTYRILDNKILN